MSKINIDVIVLNLQEKLEIIMFIFFISSLDYEKRTLLEKLYLEYKFAMFHVAFNVLRDHSLAEDAVHTAFLNLSKKAFNINDVYSRKTKGFMLVVVRNVAIDLARKRNKDRLILAVDEISQFVDDKLLPLDVTISNEEINKLQNVLAMIDPKYTDVVLLKYYNNYSNADIAKLLGISKETVRTRLHRGYKILAKKLLEGDPKHDKMLLK